MAITSSRCVRLNEAWVCSGLCRWWSTNLGSRSGCVGGYARVRSAGIPNVWRGTLTLNGQFIYFPHGQKNVGNRVKKNSRNIPPQGNCTECKTKNITQYLLCFISTNSTSLTNISPPKKRRPDIFKIPARQTPYSLHSFLNVQIQCAKCFKTITIPLQFD